MSGGSSNTQSMQTNTINPQEWGMLMSNFGTAQQNAASLTPYGGQMVADLTPAQEQSFGILSNLATNPQYQNADNSAMNTVQGILGSPANTSITPQSVTAPTITPATIAGSDLSQYENPYTSQVIDTTNAQINQQQQQALMADQQNASGEGAFGGSRSGVEQALTQ